MRKLIPLIIALLFPVSLYADIASPDNTFVQNDVYTSDFHTRLNQNFVELTDSVNNVVTGQVTNDTLTEADMADEINPRIRTYEGAACEFVYTGMTITDTANLISTVSAGTAYPRGYRINKGAATNKTFTASKDTYVDIDINGDFQYSEVANGGATPAVAANSIRIAKVVTDGTEITSVTDLRTTTCTDGPFEEIKDVATGASLEDLLANGEPVLGRGTEGFIQGCDIDWTSHTTFTVRSCAAYVNGEYRIIGTSDVVPQTADDPSTGTSGIDTGAIAASTLYNVFAMADEDNVNTLSVSYGTSSTPNGGTNYRKIGEIKTDANSLFTSRDIFVTNQIDRKEIASGWVHFNGTNTASIDTSYNVSSIVDNTTGDYTVTWDTDFVDEKYVVVGAGRQAGGNAVYMTIDPSTAKAKGTVRIKMSTDAGTLVDTDDTMVISYGEQ